MTIQELKKQIIEYRERAELDYDTSRSLGFSIKRQWYHKGRIDQLDIILRILEEE